MTKDEALTVALQQIEVAVEYIDHLGGESGMYRAALVGLKKALAQPEMRKATREEKISNPGVYEVPVQPEQPDTIALIKECQTALAEELAACDIDPPLHHILQAHDKCVAWLVGAGVLVYCTACERNVKGPCNSVECSTPEPTPQPVQIGDKT